MTSPIIGDQRVAMQTDPKQRQGNAGNPAEGFSQALNHAINDVAMLQESASKAVQMVQMGKTTNLHEAMIALEKADISFRTMLQVRNKVIEAYQEIMRMQV